MQWSGRLPRFDTKEECENGECLGDLRESIHHGISWNASQCQDLSTGGCDRDCPNAATGRYPSDSAWIKHSNGACFDSNHDLIEEWPYRSSREDCEGNSQCDSGNCEWHSCEERSWTDVADCQGSSVQSVLGCILNEPYKWDDYSDHKWVERGTCPNKEACVAAGECQNMWEYSGDQHCEDPNYNGPENTCHYGYERTKEVDVTVGSRTVKQNVTEWHHETCNACKHTDLGTCVATSGPLSRDPATGDCAEHWLRHPLGCRVLGYFKNRSGCEGAGFTFTQRLTSKEDCEAVKGCKMPFQEHYSLHTYQSCIECGGAWEPRLKWEPGNWVSGTSRPLKWVSGGVGLKQSNNGYPQCLRIRCSKACRSPS